MASKPNTAPKADKPATAATDKKARGPAPIIGAITSGVPMPEMISNRGSSSKYPFASLQIGDSFGVMNKTAANMASIVSNQNRKTKPVASPITDPNTGAVIGHNPPTEQRYQTFAAADVDPKTDPIGATVRIWRTK